mmetsp:Transcript_60779/g.168493  ORF Transcript_60779/g.168493 Transcript_60779/m.168493 type:complete len:245 (+) Transcript_60779:108-842(+)
MAELFMPPPHTRVGSTGRTARHDMEKSLPLSNAKPAPNVTRSRRGPGIASAGQEDHAATGLSVYGLQFRRCAQHPDLPAACLLRAARRAQRLVRRWRPDCQRRRRPTAPGCQEEQRRERQQRQRGSRCRDRGARLAAGTDWQRRLQLEVFRCTVLAPGAAAMAGALMLTLRAPPRGEGGATPTEVARVAGAERGRAALGARDDVRAAAAIAAGTPAVAAAVPSAVAIVALAFTAAVAARACATA